MVTQHLDTVMRVLTRCYNDDEKIGRQIDTLNYDELESLERFANKLNLHLKDAFENKEVHEKREIEENV